MAGDVAIAVAKPANNRPTKTIGMLVDSAIRIQLATKGMAPYWRVRNLPTVSIKNPPSTAPKGVQTTTTLAENQLFSMICKSFIFFFSTQNFDTDWITLFVKKLFTDPGSLLLGCVQFRILIFEMRNQYSRICHG